MGGDVEGGGWRGGTHLLHALLSNSIIDRESASRRSEGP